MRVPVSSLSRRKPDLQSLRVLVVGLGSSGKAAARLASSRGARVTAADARNETALGNAPNALRAQGIIVRCGGHPASLAAEADLVIVSPGVRPDTEVLADARRRGVPVWGELELASRFCRGRILGITGTNGKSTTTSMAGAILRSAGIPGGTGGNLGTPLSELLEQDSEAAVHAVEISSFQLETVDAFRASIAAILNFTPDHLDRYGNVDEYAAAKSKLFETQGAGDSAVVNADDPAHERFLSGVRGRVYRVRTRGPVDAGAYVENGWLRLRTGYGDEPLMEVGALPVPGEHNVSNALTAALMARLAGTPLDSATRALASFRALPHRLERIAEIRQVVFYNDSKATNLDAAERALAAFPGREVLVILGGRDKGASWTDLLPSLRSHARAAFLVGEATESIRAAVGNRIRAVSCGTVREAVKAAFSMSGPGDVVLLAPGCASHDQYANFEERGEDFRKAVIALRDEEDARA